MVKWERILKPQHILIGLNSRRNFEAIRELAAVFDADGVNIKSLVAGCADGTGGSGRNPSGISIICGAVIELHPGQDHGSTGVFKYRNSSSVTGHTVTENPFISNEVIRQEGPITQDNLWFNDEEKISLVMMLISRLETPPRLLMSTTKLP